ncbi:MAG: hypothetical protein Alpg2KO_04330 [Alphaproteobacteria bacterium]
MQFIETDMTKPRPSPTDRLKRALKTPPRSFPYYRDISRLIGLPKARDHFPTGRPRNRAALCSELSRLIYADDPAYLRRTLRRYRFTHIKEFEVDGADAMIFEDRRNTYLVFRGTESRDPRDIVRDLKAWPTQWRGKGRVHSGFAGGIDGLWADIEKDLNTRNKPLIIAGHSLGGAYATLASTLLPDHVQTYTFGAPRVGCADFTKHVDHKKLFRYVGCSDIVCRLPPKKAFPYQHAGTLRYIDRMGKIHKNISSREMLRDQARAQIDFMRAYRNPLKHSPSRILSDHAPINYTTALLGMRAKPLPGNSVPPMDRRRPVATPAKPMLPRP